MARPTDGMPGIFLQVLERDGAIIREGRLS